MPSKVGYSQWWRKSGGTETGVQTALMPIAIDHMCIVIGTPSNGAASSDKSFTAASCGINETGEGTSVNFRTASVTAGQITDALARIHILLIGY